MYNKDNGSSTVGALHSKLRKIETKKEAAANKLKKKKKKKQNAHNAIVPKVRAQFCRSEKLISIFIAVQPPSSSSFQCRQQIVLLFLSKEANKG